MFAMWSREELPADARGRLGLSRAVDRPNVGMTPSILEWRGLHRRPVTGTRP
jgi:hypothetical protein